MNDTTNGDDILGIGWHYPVRVDRVRTGELISPDRGRGGIAMARHERDIEQAIRIILSTAKGERRMRPTFGCDIHTLVFAPANEATFGLIRFYVDEALEMWEPRITLTDIDIQAGAEEGRIEILIEYEINSTKDRRALVYPFYTMGED